MRSAAYSFLTTLLLLVPISAVPLMAIFGVPQFTPVVASPLDETDEEEWDRPARKKGRSAAKAGRLDEKGLESPPDENWNWDDAPPERSRPLKTVRPGTRLAKEGSPSDETAPTDVHKGSAKTRSPARPKQRITRPIPNLTDGDEPPIRTLGIDVAEDDIQTIDSVAHARVVETDDSDEPAGAVNIPSYRRQRSGTADEGERSQDRSGSRASRNAAATEPLTWKGAVKRLNELGIRNFRLEPGVRPGEFTFTCSYTPTNSPHVTRRFEAESDDPLKAVAKVLVQVEEASQQRLLAAPRHVTIPQNRRAPE
jgi:hypothetical protein